MTDAYLYGVLTKYAVDNGPYSPVLQVQGTLAPTIQQWGGRQLLGMEPSGSFAKGTAVRTGTDIDLFVSLSSTTTNPLAEIYESLFVALAGAGYKPRCQNVSIGLRLGGIDVDVVPARRQSPFGADHSLYSTRSNSWLQTNVNHHVGVVQGSNRLDEIRLLKVWRNRRGLDFPSFYLELVVIEALYGLWSGKLAANVVTALEFIRDRITTVRIVDPANTNNIISDVLTMAGKQTLASAARSALASSWETEFA